ncbi:MAG: PhnD/SsuA/transferrin family substrate-binding protein [Ahrensia sp.]|nr:PhnD/SsuA/transferrin family substrate-binding protein [Ahrensia sp.]
MNQATPGKGLRDTNRSHTNSPSASLPMYDWPEIAAETNSLWQSVATAFSQAGLAVPEALTRDDNVNEHWLSPDLLFSQTCGYPLATRLWGRVTVLGTPVYDVAGCDGPTYSSAIIVRKDADFADLGAAATGTFAYNLPVSLSGYRCLSPMIGDPVRFFANSVESGSHRVSARMVAVGDADIAAIDAVCWHLLQRVEPQAADKLRVLTWSPSFPALPFITSLGRSEGELRAMRSSLAKAVRDAAHEMPTLRLRDVEFVDEQRYAALADL